MENLYEIELVLQVSPSIWTTPESKISWGILVHNFSPRGDPDLFCWILLPTIDGRLTVDHVASGFRNLPNSLSIIDWDLDVAESVLLILAADLTTT